ncbi:MAG: extracellular solute-binding protein [Candidatus Pacebacteria bacterium]|nr:extracellular solute-binding protein [Candidatus Paceibacterota bacterium]MBP9851450.1 extracellular solute-binding protein [Candidatus Paceibacterota bacterium]
MKKLTPFQMVFIGLFMFLALLGFLTFSGFIKIGSDSKTATLSGKVTMWGTVPAPIMRDLFEDFSRANPDFTVVYNAIEPETFNQELLEAMAEGKGPDMFLLQDDLARSYLNRITAISYAKYPAANFKTNFASATDIFTTPSGILALPLTIDPLIMYYNRSILNTNGVVYPPSNWNEFSDLIPKLTKKNDANQITTSAVALGQFANITNAKDIITTLFLQTGNPIVERDENRIYRSTLIKEAKNNQQLVGALNYYTSFANPLLPNYSWHRGLPKSRDYFISENLAFYFGYASELPGLMNRNPNLDLQIAEMPQMKNASFKVTKSRVTGVAISAFAKDQALALAIAGSMTNASFVRSFARVTGTAPARRDLLATQLADEYMPNVFKSALYSKSWFDPSPADTDNVFKSMVDDVLSNVSTSDNVIQRANGQIDLLLVK